jgi:hypothetical protein
MAGQEQKGAFRDMPVGTTADAWLAANKEVLLEMAAWDRENEIFEPDQQVF